jgi:hypothetical protein
LRRKFLDRSAGSQSFQHNVLVKKKNLDADER